MSLQPVSWRPARRLRATSIGLIRRMDEILVMAAKDDHGRIKGWRPPGGGIELGEAAGHEVVFAFEPEWREDQAEQRVQTTAHRRLIGIVLVALCLQASACTPTNEGESTDRNPFVGAWRITETVTTSSTGSVATDESPEMGIYIFTERHFGIMLVPGSEREPFFFRDHSDAERLRAYDNFSADAGTYEYDATTITFHNMIAKIPDVVQFSLSHDWRMEGADMIFEFTGGWAPPDSRIRYRLSRLE